MMLCREILYTLAAILIALAVGGCAPSTPGRAEPSRLTPPESSPAATTAPDPSVARADALVADMQRREAAYREAERNAPPPPPAPGLDDFRAAAVPPVSVSAETPIPRDLAQAPPATPVSVDPRQTESYWKDQMRELLVRRNEHLRRFDGALAQADAARDQMETKNSAIFVTAQASFNSAMSEVNRLKAEVENAQAAIARLEEDARRAGVPPGWLRQ